MTCGACGKDFCFLCNADLSADERHAQFERHRLAPDRARNPLGECFLWDADNRMLDGHRDVDRAKTPVTVFRMRTHNKVARARLNIPSLRSFACFTIALFSGVSFFISNCSTFCSEAFASLTGPCARAAALGRELDCFAEQRRRQSEGELICRT